MARIYVTEPSKTGGVGAMGVRTLIKALRSAGHDVLRVHLYGSTEPGESTMEAEHTRDATLLPRPDAWFVSLLYPRQFVDLPDTLWRLGVHPLAEKRQPSDPLIAFGGQSMIAPEPIADFADVMALGDGEVTGVESARNLDAGATRGDVMRELDGRPGFYVPSRSPKAAFVRVEGEMAPGHVEGEGGRSPIIEAARGCASKCAFCPIGWAGGSYRERPMADVEQSLLALKGKRVNVFAPDYSSIGHLDSLEEAITSAGCKNSGKDARLDKTLKILNKGDGVKSYSFGIEGLSERLRAAIGKPLPGAKIVDALRLLSGHVQQVTLYLILGFPGEGDDDLKEFIGLLDQIREVYFGKSLHLTTTHLHSIPHTPLQWIDARYSYAASERQKVIFEKIKAWWEPTGERPRTWIVQNWNGPDRHEYDGWAHRADRRASAFYTAIRGCAAKMADGRWRDVAGKVGLDVQADLGPLTVGAPTPWDHVDVGIDRRLVERAWRNYERRMGLDTRAAA